eukprot:CAMPEP_0119326698 /NCGR_PEP_ID=MMETSP1333-20130426/69088_1 /TAXON_ID=418940 /ORGANISM="Scyphosphaera apsteinii, Strain RCC1455" /LENGTH=267 /DNA_ID=CAMNT_0007335079 /DNA_START=67 /DNA_END=870 /DNA_ORIENTATION=-
MKSVFGHTASFNGCLQDDPAPCPDLPVLRTPDALFSANYADGPIDCKDEFGRYRTEQTIAALAKSGATSLNLDIDNTYGFMPQLCGAGIDANFKELVAAAGGQITDFMAEFFSDDAVEKASAWFSALPTKSADGKLSTCIPYGGGGKIPGADPMAGMCCNKAAAEVIRAKLVQKGVNTILVSWEHVNIQWLAVALGAPKAKVLDVECTKASGGKVKECWDGDDYDIIYELRYSADGLGNPIAVNTHMHQGFEWIGGQKGTCGVIGEA